MAMTGNAPQSPCALLWDESFLWGVMARKALKAAGLPFELIRADEVRGGLLSRYRMVFVPGGWASGKIDALGAAGVEAIRRFVAAGGGYLGICGGAGMAAPNGLGLLPIRRLPSSERVPSFSGPIRLSLAAHVIWKNVEAPVFWAWWPPQLRIVDPDVRALARYEEAQPDAFSSDIPIAEGEAIGWPGLESRYRLLLNPARLYGEPVVVEGRFDRGRVILSLVHFDTPGDRNGARVLRNLWAYLASHGIAAPGAAQDMAPAGAIRSGEGTRRHLSPAARQALGQILEATGNLIEAGEKKGLWYRRHRLLLQWRRGVRGLEYSTMAAMIAEIAGHLGESAGDGDRRPRQGAGDPSRLQQDLQEIRDLILPFCEQAKRLLALERLAMANGPLSPRECRDDAISGLRLRLFGPAMSHGGEFKHLMDRVDHVLYGLIREG